MPPSASSKKPARPLGVRPGEGAAGVAEHLAFKQGGGDGGAVHGDKAALAGLGTAESLSHVAFAGTALPGDEHVAVQLGELVGPVADLRRGGPAAEEGGEGALLRTLGLFPFPVAPLGGLDGVVPLRDSGADVLNVPELHDDALQLSVVCGDGQNGGHQLVAVDLIGHVPELRGLSGHHLVQVPLKQGALEKLPEVVPGDFDLGAGAFADKGRAPQQIADALLPGGVALFLPELHLPGKAVHNDHLADAPEIVHGVGGFAHGHGGGFAVDGRPDGNFLTGGGGQAADRGQLQRFGVPAGQGFIDRPAVRRVEEARRGDPVSGAELLVPDVQPFQVGGGQVSVVGPDGGVRDNHQVPGPQLSGAVGILAVVEQAKVALGLLVDMGDGALPVQCKHGLGGGLHDALQHVHAAFSFPVPVPGPPAEAADPAPF